MNKIVTHSAAKITGKTIAVLVLLGCTSAHAQNWMYESGPGGTPPLIMGNGTQQNSQQPVYSPPPPRPITNLPDTNRSYIPQPVEQPRGANFPEPYQAPQPYGR